MFNKGRYVIEVLLDGEVEWRVFYSAKSHRTKQGALGELYSWRDMKWDFPADKPEFRIFDTKKQEVYEDFETRALRELRGK